MMSFKKFGAALVLVSVVFVATASADIKEGIKVYNEHFAKYMGSGNKFAASETQAGWQKMCANGYERLIYKYKNMGSRDFHQYLLSDKFKNEDGGDLCDYLMQFASDSGKK